MKYTKEPKSFDQQSDLLISRGLIADKNKLTEYLSQVNYYRLSGYLYPYRSGEGENYIPGTSLELINEIYEFDTDLRLLTLSAIEKIDVAILRTRMVERFTLQCGAFCYAHQENYGPKLSEEEFTNLLSSICDNVYKSKEDFVESYLSRYSSEQYLPFWMVAEACSLGQLSQVYRDVKFNVSAPIAKEIGLHSEILASWIHTLSVIRNICAHHSRLWNRNLRVKPLLPPEKHRPEFYVPRRTINKNYFVILTIIQYLIRNIYSKFSFVKGFKGLLKEYPNVSIKLMGFPDDWEEYKIIRF